MSAPRSILAILVAGLLSSCGKPDYSPMDALLDDISHSPVSDLPPLLHGYEDVDADSQSLLVDMLKPLRAPSADRHMTAEAHHTIGRFSMLVARVPWPRPGGSPDLQPNFVGGGRWEAASSWLRVAVQSGHVPFLGE